MEIIKVNVPDNFILCDTSDYHVGSPNTSEESIKQMVDDIASTKNKYLIFKGDAIECILPNDKRFLHSAINEYKTPAQQADRVIELLKPIAKKILAWGIGNHEMKLWNTMDFGKYMADSLGVQYGAYNFKIHYLDSNDRLMFKSYHTHGWGGLTSNAKDDIQYEANRKAALKHKLVKSGIGDCIYMSRGHDHQLITVDPTVENKLYLSDDGTGIHQHYHVPAKQDERYIAPDSRWYATTGSFRKLYSKPGTMTTDYGEIAGYSPSEIGYAEVAVNDRNVTAVRKVVL